MKCDIAIVGSGLNTRLAAALLRNKSSRKIIAIETPEVEPANPLNGHFGYVGASDNITRQITAHGEECARSLWQMSHQGCIVAEKLARNSGMVHHPLHKCRPICSEHEMVEAREAESFLQQLSNSERLLPNDHVLTKGGLSLIPPTQLVSAEQPGFVWDESELGSALKSVETLQLSRAPNIDAQPDRVVITSDTFAINAELALILDRNAMVDLDPDLSDILVEVPDYWAEFYLPEKYFYFDTAFFAHHGNVWGLQRGKNLAFGGARYLFDSLKSGHVDKSQKVLDHYRKILGGLFKSVPDFSDAKLRSRTACLPCDELPLIGPHYSNHRILMIQGLWGWGLNMFIAAVQEIGELIEGRECKYLHRQLWPERIRSL